MSAKKREQLPDIEGLRQKMALQVETHKKTLVGIAAVLVIVGVGLILFFTFRKRAEEEQWTSLLNASLYHQLTAPVALQQLRQDAGGDLEAHVLLNLAQSYAGVGNRNYEKALEILDELEKEHPDSLLVRLPWLDQRYSMLQEYRRWIEAEMEWEKANEYQKPEVDTSRVALVETSRGSFWIGFYPEFSPKHVESFIARAKAGDFNGTSVTRLSMFRMDFGGELSRDDDPFNDDEPLDEDLLDPEPGRYKIRPDRGAVSTLAVDGGESPTRITVVIGEMSMDLDKVQTLFGRVLPDRYPELRALDEMKLAETYGRSDNPDVLEAPQYATIPDHPIEEIRVERISIWSDEKIEDGHDWDTSTVVKPDPALESREEEGAGGDGDPSEGNGSAEDGGEGSEVDPDAEDESKEPEYPEENGTEDPEKPGEEPK